MRQAFTIKLPKVERKDLIIERGYQMLDAGYWMLANSPLTFAMD
jgi:hypothetical protein